MRKNKPKQYPFFDLILMQKDNFPSCLSSLRNTHIYQDNSQINHQLQLS